ncbi:hypothetical protein P154DRAFT_385698, partial [Amniculicola lignicola CBS 123094]
IALRRQQFIQISALSTFNSKVLAYHSFNREPKKWLPHLRKAVGIQITQSQHREVVTINTNTGLFWYNLNPLMRNNWRASLVPAATVIPALIAYIKVVAVKKLI